MSDTFSLLWGKILRSSLWVQESKETRLVWITLLALKDQNGEVQSSVIGLADSAKVTPEECREALRVLSSPDPNDTSKVEEGRRIREVRGGWQIVNHDLYQFSTEEKREYWRRKKAIERERKAQETGKRGRRTKPDPKEQAFERALENGASEAELDKIVESSLPQKTAEIPGIQSYQPIKKEFEAWESETFTVLRPEGTPELKRVLHKIEPVSISSSSNEAAKMHTQPEVVNEVALSPEEDERPWHFENGKKVYD